MLRTPASGFAMTDAASRNSTVAGGDGAGVAPWAPATAVAAGAAAGTAAPVAIGTILSVSRRMSLMFAIRVSQNLLAESVLMIEIELFCAGPAVPPLVPWRRRR